MERADGMRCADTCRSAPLLGQGGQRGTWPELRECVENQVWTPHGDEAGSVRDMQLENTVS